MTIEQIRKAQQCLRDSAFVCAKCTEDKQTCGSCRFGLNILVADELEKLIPKEAAVLTIMEFGHRDRKLINCPTCGQLIEGVNV